VFAVVECVYTEQSFKDLVTIFRDQLDVLSKVSGTNDAYFSASAQMAAALSFMRCIDGAASVAQHLHSLLDFYCKKAAIEATNPNLRAWH
jgi:hypothetical protein